MPQVKSQRYVCSSTSVTLGEYETVESIINRRCPPRRAFPFRRRAAATCRRQRLLYEVINITHSLVSNQGSSSINRIALKQKLGQSHQGHAHQGHAHQDQEEQYDQYV